MPDSPEVPAGEISSGEPGVARGESVRSIVMSKTLRDLGGVAVDEKWDVSPGCCLGGLIV